MWAGSVFWVSPLMQQAQHVFEVGTMLFSYFWLAWCLQNDSPRATNFPGRSCSGEKSFLCFSSHNTACCFYEDETKGMQHLLLWEYSPPLVSTFPVCKGCYPGFGWDRVNFLPGSWWSAVFRIWAENNVDDNTLIVLVVAK